MPIKTREGWKTKGQINAQEAAWKKARKAMVEKLGVDTPGDTTKIKARAKEVFLEIDTDNNGQIDQAELTVAMSSMGVKLKSSEVVNMMKEADADGDLLIDLDEFIDLCCNEVARYYAVMNSSFCSLQ